MSIKYWGVYSIIRVGFNQFKYICEFYIFMKKAIITLTLLLAISFVDAQTYNFYFGNLHAHTGYSDGNDDGNSPNATSAFNYAKSSLNMHFLGISEHNHNESTNMSLANWTNLKNETAAANQDGTFVCMYGMEWGTISTGGHFLIYEFDSLIGWNPGAHQIFVAKGDYTSLYPIIKNKSGAFATLAHPASSDFDGIFSNAYNSVWDDAVVGVAIFNGPSSSTNTTYSNPSTTSFNARFEDLLKKGYKVGPTIDHDNHATTFGRTTQGRTVVLATSLTKSNIADAYRNMRFYASQDYNLKVSYTIGTKQMGSITTLAGTPTISVSVSDIDLEATTSIVVKAGVPGSGSNPTTLTSNTNSSTLTFTDNTLANLATKYYYVEVTQADGHKAWTSPIWYTRNDAVLPITLTRFTATISSENKVKLNWTTATEYNNDRFEIEHSLDGSNFNLIGTLDGKLKSTELVEYTFTHESPGAGINYYRLKQIDLDGTITYSDLVAASLKTKEIKFKNHILREGQLSFAIESPEAMDANFQLIDITGKLIATSNQKIQVGLGTFDISIPDIPTGIYTATLTTPIGAISYKLKK
jgi:trimeric autotransporter adhesin